MQSLLDALHADAATNGKAAVARKLGVSRTTVSLALNGKYPASLDKLLQRAEAVYARFECPHLAAQITLVQCREYALRPCPTTSPRESRHWRACQKCALRPTEETAS
jgi:hypothetical protein